MKALTKSMARLLRKVDAGPCHALPAGKLTVLQTEAAWAAGARRLLSRLPARGRWPERWVLTTTGAWALGIFDQGDFDASLRAYRSRQETRVS